jgi:hypothetical protein
VEGGEARVLVVMLGFPPQAYVGLSHLLILSIVPNDAWEVWSAWPFATLALNNLLQSVSPSSAWIALESSLAKGGSQVAQKEW